MAAAPAPSGEDVAAAVGVTAAGLTAVAVVARGAGWVLRRARSAVTRADFEGHERRLAALEAHEKERDTQAAVTAEILKRVETQTAEIYNFLLGANVERK